MEPSLYEIRKRLALEYPAPTRRAQRAKIEAETGVVVPDPVLEPTQPTQTEASGGEREQARAMALETDAGTVVLTAPASVLVREIAEKHREDFQVIHGRFVEADSPNLNGAYWSSADLQLGAPTVAGGPLNWLHEETHIIGTLLAGNFVETRQAAGFESTEAGNHITTDAVAWKFLFPRETSMIQMASDMERLYYSMECIAREVACQDLPGRPGCGEQFPYLDYLHHPERICSHLAKRQSARRFVDPIFQGAAVIIPPVKPGWAGATASVRMQAAEITEKADLDLERPEAEAMVGRILQWANRPAGQR